MKPTHLISALMKMKETESSKYLFPLRIEHLLKEIVRIYLNRMSQGVSRKRKGKVAVYANDSIGNDILVNGLCDERELSIVSSFLNGLKRQFSEEAMVDVGANVGNHTLFLCDMFRCVYSYEPNPDTYKLLEINTAGCRNVVARNVALGSARGGAVLREPMGNLGMSSIVAGHGQADLLHQIVVVPLDEEQMDANVGLIKIDVERSEYQVLLGSMQTIERFKPIIVLEQLRPEFVGGTGDTKSIDLLRSLGYRFYFIDYRGLGNTSRILRYLIYALNLLVGRVRLDLRGPVLHFEPGNYPYILCVPDGVESRMCEHA